MVPASPPPGSVCSADVTDGKGGGSAAGTAPRTACTEPDRHGRIVMLTSCTGCALELQTPTCKQRSIPLPPPPPPVPAATVCCDTATTDTAPRAADDLGTTIPAKPGGTKPDARMAASAGSSASAPLAPLAVGSNERRPLLAIRSFSAETSAGTARVLLARPCASVPAAATAAVSTSSFCV